MFLKVNFLIFDANAGGNVSAYRRMGTRGAVGLRSRATGVACSQNVQQAKGVNVG
jgi:hypothetical protein